MKKLTPKQEKFVTTLVGGVTRRQAYKIAYNAKDMKNETIDKRASELFNKENIQLRYKQLINEKQKAIIESASNISDDLIYKINKYKRESETVIEFIEKFISENFRKFCLMLSLISLVLTALLQWSLYKWIRTLGNTMLGVGIFAFIISLFGNVFSSMFAALLSFGGELGFGKAVWSSVICGGVGIILLILYSIINNCVKKKEKENEISQNA
jgi:lipopolysaccharide export LptBFGC system permease protein LptF